MSDMVTVKGGTADAGILPALDVAAEVLGLHVAYAYIDRFHFSLGGGWSIAISPDSAARFRVESCRLCRPVSTMWVTTRNLERLAGLVERMSREVRELV